MLKLYCAPGTISAAPAILLHEGRVHFEEVRVDFASAEQRGEAYLTINPKGRVPALATPGGVLTETGAILEYLAETAVPGFVPADPLARARMREVMYFLASTVHVNHAHKRRGARWSDDPASWEAMRAKVPETMTESAGRIEALIEGPLLFGETPTLADIYLAVMASWFEGDGVDLAPFPKLRAFMAAMDARPAVRAVRARGLMA